MYLVIYGDFNCPYSYLASSRADILLELGIAQVEWRAVEHDPGILEPSERVEGDLLAMLPREVAEIRTLMRVGETLDIESPPVYPNTARAVAAFAATPFEEDHDTRRRLFAALWRDGRDLGDRMVVRDVVGDCSEAGSGLVTGWRNAWLGLGRPMVPMLVLPDGRVSRGLGALARLADLGSAGTRDQGLPRSRVAT
jgi:2-hydroxychromene-2-carboxylate isomerase